MRINERQAHTLCTILQAYQLHGIDVLSAVLEQHKDDLQPLLNFAENLYHTLPGGPDDNQDSTDLYRVQVFDIDGRYHVPTCNCTYCVKPILAEMEKTAEAKMQEITEKENKEHGNI